MQLHPRILYIAEFIPSNLNGGSILIGRLFDEYPPGDVTILSTSVYERQSPREGRLRCRHIIFPASNKTGRWGWGRVKAMFDFLAMLSYLPIVIWLIQKKKAEIIATVSAGHFFILGGLAAFVTQKPLVVIVHDEFVSGRSLIFLPFKKIEQFLFLRILRYARKIYVVSFAMREMLRDRYGVESVLQLPAAERFLQSSDGRVFSEKKPHSEDVVKIMFSGNVTGLSADNIELLNRAVLDGYLEKYDLKKNVEVHLYCGVEKTLSKQYKQKYSVFYHPWISQREIRSAIFQSHILYLPHSFKTDQAVFNRTSLPTKIAEYLASGRPILVSAPVSSALYQYFNQNQLGWFVTTPDPEVHAQVIENILMHPRKRDHFRIQARRLFDKYHDLEAQRQSFYEDLHSISKS